jgi:uncharacterized membrane protein YphA (DoxX/SURF4 family)
MGLLLLRVAVGVSLGFQGLAYLRVDDGPWATVILGLLMILTGALLLIGFLTPVACILTQLISTAVALSFLPSTMFDLPDGRPTTLFLFVMAVAILLLGPGAFSMDARWFGRREVVIPR